MKKHMEQEPKAVYSRHDIVARCSGLVLVHGTFDAGMVRSLTRSDLTRALKALRDPDITHEMVARPKTEKPAYAIIPARYHQGHNDLGEVHP